MDRTDQESIQIMLRNTTYYADEAPGPRELSRHRDEVQMDQGSPTSSNADSCISHTPDRSSQHEQLEPIVEASPDSRHSLEVTRLSTSTVDSNESSSFGWVTTHVAEPQTAVATFERDPFATIHRVLCQHSATGQADRTTVERLYRKLLDFSSQHTSAGGWETDKVEQFCAEELAKQHEPQYSGLSPSTPANRKARSSYFHDALPNGAFHNQGKAVGHQSSEVLHHIHALPEGSAQEAAPQKVGSILGDVEEWDSISPTAAQRMQYGDQFGSRHPSDNGDDIAPPLPPKDNVPNLDRDGSAATRITTLTQALESGLQRGPAVVALEADPIPTTHPSHPLPPQSPPNSSLPLPSSSVSDLDSVHAISPSPCSGQSFSGVIQHAPFRPQVPRRVTSLTKITSRPGSPLTDSVKPSAKSSSVSGEHDCFERPSLDTSSKRSSPTPEQRRLRKRRHVIKELIDTEATFGRDITVIDDIYKSTSSSCLDLSAEDVKTLFGNSAQIAQFSTQFLASLKLAARSVYVIPISERFDSKRDDKRGSRITSTSTDGAVASDDQSSVHEPENTNVETDRQTFVGEAFKLHTADMEKVYTEYLRNHDAANRRLQVLQQKPNVEIWLKECRTYASDLTAAWDLDSLLVKPVQRILKYPLLLSQLIDSTPEDHPDYEALKSSFRELTEVSMRINEMKKHTDLVQQGLGRKRKESDVRIGLSKAFGRRTEKLRQHVGISEMVEDQEYNQLRERYAENFGQLVVVGRDVRGYKTEVGNWVERMNLLAASADEWVDVGHTTHTQLESKLRRFAMTIREIVSVAFPEHLNAIQKSVLDPLFGGARMLESLQKDAKGLLQKRDKKLIDYARFKNMRDRGDKLDKRTVEKMEQWEALNREAKERMFKLLELTTKLVQSCLQSLVQIHSTWVHIWRRKLPPTMNVKETELDEVRREWQQDFDYQEASALSLGICNGSLVAEAVNMINFSSLTPATTLNGDDSPRQPSWNSSNKRSTSLNSETSPALGSEFGQRHSGGFTASPMIENVSDFGLPSFAQGRIRAASAASGRNSALPDTSSRTAALYAQLINKPATRPSTSTGRNGEASPGVPRLSVDAPSPQIGPLVQDTPANRPGSGSTFFSTVAEPHHALPSPALGGSATFSSALPMSDSPRLPAPHPSDIPGRDYEVLFPVASVYEFNIDRARREAGFPYLTYVAGEIFDVIGERGELWLARNQDDPQNQVGWIWNKHFAKVE